MASLNGTDSDVNFKLFCLPVCQRVTSCFYSLRGGFVPRDLFMTLTVAWLQNTIFVKILLLASATVKGSLTRDFELHFFHESVSTMPSW